MVFWKKEKNLLAEYPQLLGRPVAKGERKMKTLRCILVLAAVLLAGCSTGEVEYQEKTAAASELPAVVQNETQSTEAPVTGEVSAAQTQNALPPLSEQEVLYAYDRAVEAYGWFDLDTLPCTDQAATMDGYVYQQVDYDGIATMDDLRTYLGGLFSQDIIDRLLPENTPGSQYREVDGKLYVRPSARDADNHKGTVTTSVRQENGTAYSVNVTVEILGEDLATVTGMECDSFSYELVNGRWVFTDFYLVY